MNRYPTMPDAATLARDVLNVCFYPTAARERGEDGADRGTTVPKVVTYKCTVVVNLVGVVPRVRAGAVYLLPAAPHRREHARLVAVVAHERVVGKRRIVDWAEAVVGEVEQTPAEAS